MQCDKEILVELEVGRSPCYENKTCLLEDEKGWQRDLEDSGCIVQSYVEALVKQSSRSTVRVVSVGGVL